jgi:hypothetical protein
MMSSMTPYSCDHPDALTRTGLSTRMTTSKAVAWKQAFVDLLGVEAPREQKRCKRPAAWEGETGAGGATRRSTSRWLIEIRDGPVSTAEREAEQSPRGI